VLDGDVEPTISSLIEAVERGDRVASERLFGALYAELHRTAKRELARRGGAVSLSATTLLHEAYLAMSSRGDPTFPDEPRFMGYAARVMRRLIIDHVRERQAQNGWPVRDHFAGHRCPRERDQPRSTHRNW